MSRSISNRLRERVFSRFAGQCAYCHTQEDLTAVSFELDHIVPLVAGGSTVFENLALACPTCNRYKGGVQSAADPVSLDIVPLFHPHVDSWDSHFRWTDDGTRLLGLTPTGRATVELLRMNRQELVRVRRMWVEMGLHPPRH